MNVLLVPAHPGFPGQIPQSRKTVVVVVVLLVHLRYFEANDTTMYVYDALVNLENFIMKC